MSKKQNKRRKIIGIIAIIGIAIIAILSFFIQKNNNNDFITYDEVISYVNSNDVARVELRERSNEIKLILNDGTENSALIPDVQEFSNFISDEIENGNKITYEIVNQGLTIASIALLLVDIIRIILVIGIFIVLLYLVFSTFEEVEPVESDIKFSDVAGIDEEKSQLEQIVEYLKNPDIYTQAGARVPKGILLYGEPGTGKTLLAKAIAGEAGVPFFQATGSSFEEVFVGLGASRVRKLFKSAKEVAPCIIFIDEIEAMGEKRYSNNESNNEQTLNQLLAEMDGFDTQQNVIVIAATNHIEVLDPALIRPGRYDRQIYIPMPDVGAREKILTVHSKNKHLAEEVSLLEIAQKTVGFSGAELENILNEAAILAVNRKSDMIFKQDIEEAIARVLVGLEKKNAVITDSDKYLTAVHESGHAIISAILRPDMKNLGISIIPRGKAGGYNFFNETEKMSYNKTDLLQQIQVLYGGRVAEELILNNVSTGAAGDLEQATYIAHKMVTKCAMMEDSLVTYIQGEPDFNAQLDKIKMQEINNICKESYDNTCRILKGHKEQLLKLTNILMEKEYLSQEEIAKFMSENL